MSADNRQLRLQKWLQKDELSVYEGSMLLCGHDPYEFSGIYEALENLEGNDRESLVIAYRHLSESSGYVMRNWQLMIDPRDEFELEVEKAKISRSDLAAFAIQHCYAFPESHGKIKHHHDDTYLEIINGLTQIVYKYYKQYGALSDFKDFRLVHKNGKISAHRLMELLNEKCINVRKNTDKIIIDAIDLKKFEQES